METDPFLDQVTFLIKTFERPESLEVLLRSLDRYYPKSKVIILNDGQDAWAPNCLLEDELDLDWRWIHAKYDIGLAKGRNILVSECKTPYCVMLDDDYEMANGSVWREAWEILKQEGLDLLAVILWNTKKDKLDAICQNVRIEGNGIVQTKVPIDGLTRADMVNNCFIAYTEHLKLAGWDNVFKIAGEHTDFAITCYNQTLDCAIIPLDGVLHHQGGSQKYKKHRMRSHASLLLSKYGCDKLVQSNGKVLNIKPGVNYLEYCRKHGYTPYSRSA